MDNEDTQVTRVAHVALDDSETASDTFLRAILEHEKATDSLGAAIRNQDPELAAIAADVALWFFLIALALFHRLENAKRTRSDLPRLGTAWFVVRTHHRAFTDLLSRTQSELGSPELHQLLEQHWISLGLAMDGLGPTADNELAGQGTSGQATSGAET